MATFPCPHCGNPVEPSHLYCPHCSRSLRLNVEAPPVVETARGGSPSRTITWVVVIGVISIVAMFVLPAILLPGIVRKGTLGARGAAGATACLSNIKQLAVGNLIYMSDYDDHFAPDANIKTAIMPYVKNTAIFACAETKIEFAVNDGVIGVEAPLITDPAATVMLYEGYNKVLSGPHGGSSNVAYMDSHAKRIAQTAPIDFSVKLTKPPAKKPAPKKP